MHRRSSRSRSHHLSHLRAPESLGPRICISYEIITRASAASGEAEEAGWIDEEGVSMSPDEYDLEEGITAVDKAVRLLRSEGVEPSSNGFAPGMWYTHYEQQQTSGEWENRSFHLKGFTEAQERAIYEELFPQHRVRHNGALGYLGAGMVGAGLGWWARGQGYRLGAPSRQPSTVLPEMTGAVAPGPGGDIIRGEIVKAGIDAGAATRAADRFREFVELYRVRKWPASKIRKSAISRYPVVEDAAWRTANQVAGVVSDYVEYEIVRNRSESARDALLDVFAAVLAEEIREAGS